MSTAATVTSEVAQPSDAFARSYEQRIAALHRANEIRSRRKDFKRQLKHDGNARTEVLAAIVEVPDWAGTMRVFDLLLALPGFGRVRTNRVLKRARVSPSKTLDGLSDRQRGELAYLFAALPLTEQGKFSTEPLDRLI